MIFSVNAFFQMTDESAGDGEPYTKRGSYYLESSGSGDQPSKESIESVCADMDHEYLSAENKPVYVKYVGYEKACEVLESHKISLASTVEVFSRFLDDAEVTLRLSRLIARGDSEDGGGGRK